jgi:hypothetical protein
MKMKSILAITATMLAAAPVLFADAGDQPTTIDKVPAAAAAAIKQAAGSATLEKVTSASEDGKAAFEAAWTKDGHGYEITVAATGEVLGLEETLSMSELPAAVQTAITSKAGGQKIGKVEKVTEDGKTSYETVLKTKNGKSEFSWDASGAELKTESAEEPEKGGESNEEKD